MLTTLENTNGIMSRPTAHGYLVFFASVLVFSAFCRVQGNSCPNGWRLLEGSCYFFSNHTATWDGARERCKETGGDLVTVSSESQNAFVVSHYSSLSCLSEGAWLGLRRSPRNTSRWVWLDDLDAEPTYTKWHRKEPMNDRLNKNCTEIHPSKSIYWYGRECFAQGCYICVKDANECINDKICSGQPCINIVGSYRCACGKGYMTKQDKECEDVDECRDKNGGCPHECVNTPGSYLCHCRDGFITENNGTVCRPQHTTPETKTKSDVETSIVTIRRTNDTMLLTRPPPEKPADQLIEEPKTSPLTSFGVLFTMAIPLCFIVCFLVLCYIKGPGKEKNKEAGISGRLIESVSPFLDTAFMDPSDTNGNTKGKKRSVTTKNSSFSEEEPMV